ncbi:hypothetical protein V6N13_016314 [Hibiscus sabdariffa]
MALRKIVASLWGKDTLTKVSLAGSNLYVFSFANLTVRDLVLENGSWHIQHNPLILRRWEPNLQRLDFDLTLAWVYLCTWDSITASRERLEFVKVCVEVLACVRLPRAIPFKMRDKSVVTVKVKMPWMPASCSSCKSFGHSEKLCSEYKIDNIKAVEWRVKGVDGVGAVAGDVSSEPSTEVD